MSVGIVRLQGERALKAQQRFVEPFQLLQGKAAVVEDLAIIGLERDRFVVARQRLLKSLQVLQRVATVIEGIRMSGLSASALS
jgi:hypothetical protein